MFKSKKEKRKIHLKRTCKNVKKSRKNISKKLGGEPTNTDREQEQEQERLINLLISLLLCLGFNVEECRKIYDDIKKKIESGISINLRNMMEFINFSFSINQDLTTMHDVPQIFNFERSPIQMLEGVGKIPSESERKDFIIKMESYSTIEFAKLKELMSLIGFSEEEQYWITTRLELIHNTNDGPISIHKVVSKITSMIQTVGKEVRRSFIEVVSVYDHYESFL
jgi:hypothetical protein